jgi:ferric-dicitrate binding protein FerR (iron transport regulator)
MTSAARSAGDSAQQAARSEPVKLAARVGLFAYGVTHLLIAWLALQVAFGGGGQEADQTGAFQTLAQQPFGRVLLWVLVVGFAAVALWRLEQAVWGYGYVSDTGKRLRKRVSAGAKVVLFAVLAVVAGSTAAGGGSSGGGGQQGLTATVLGWPGGQLLVGAVGLGIIAVGGKKVYDGVKKKFLDDMSLPSDQSARQVAVRTGQVGFVAKGIAIALIGGLVVAAAVQFRPDQAAGLDAALKTLAGQPYGPYLLAAVALGLAAYGVFCFFDARYHRV